MAQSRSTRHPREEAAGKLAIEAARLVADRHCEDVTILDLRGISPVCDYFVIGTGTSPLQMRSVAEEIVDLARGMGERPFCPPRVAKTAWVLLDFVTVVVHLFDGEHRQFYALEMLWGDAPTVPWERPSPSPAHAGP